MMALQLIKELPSYITERVKCCVHQMLSNLSLAVLELMCFDEFLKKLVFDLLSQNYTHIIQCKCKFVIMFAKTKPACQIKPQPRPPCKNLKHPGNTTVAN